MIAFDQTKPLLKAFASAGVDTKKLYFVDGNTSDYSSELDAGLLEGSKGTIPGVNPSDDFIKRLESTGVDLKNTTTYGAETYDGIILAALAAQKGGSASGQYSIDAVSNAAQKWPMNVISRGYHENHMMEIKLGVPPVKRYTHRTVEQVRENVNECNISW